MHPLQVQEVPEFSPETVQSLTDIADNFSIEDALQVKKVRPLSSKLLRRHTTAASPHGRKPLPGLASVLRARRRGLVCKATTCLWLVLKGCLQNKWMLTQGWRKAAFCCRWSAPPTMT